MGILLAAVSAELHCVLTAQVRCFNFPGSQVLICKLGMLKCLLFSVVCLFFSYFSFLCFACYCYSSKSADLEASKPEADGVRCCATAVSIVILPI